MSVNTLRGDIRISDRPYACLTSYTSDGDKLGVKLPFYVLFDKVLRDYNAESINV